MSINLLKHLRVQHKISHTYKYIYVRSRSVLGVKIVVSNIPKFKGYVIVNWAPVLSLLVSLKLASLSWAISTLSRTITLIYPFSSTNPFNLSTASLHKQPWQERLFIFWSTALARASGCEKLATWLEFCGLGSIQTPFCCWTLNKRLLKFDHRLIVSNGIFVI